MLRPAPDQHPQDLEFRLYVRGSLQPGHAMALLAHCLVCEDCKSRLARMLPGIEAESAGYSEGESVGG